MKFQKKNKAFKTPRQFKKESKKEYDALSKDLFEMRKVLNQTVFNNKWRIIKWLMK